MTATASAEQLLRQKGVRPTAIRLKVLCFLMQSSKAYTHADVEEAFDNQPDRVSLYRTFLRLIEVGLIQKLIDSRGNCAYFYEAVTMLGGQPHLKCSHCETIVPLPALPEAYLTAMRQYQIKTIHLLAEGTCLTCRQLTE